MATKSVISIEMGPFLKCAGSMVNVHDTSGERETKLVMTCPVCQASQLDQRYHCIAGCVPGPTAPAAAADGWKVSEVPTRGRLEGKKLYAVDAAAIAAAKEASTTQPKGVFSVLPKPAAQFETDAAPGPVTYAFTPDRPDEVYTMILDGAADPDVALIGVINLRGSEKLYRLVNRNGVLHVMQFLRPEETQHVAAVVAPVVSPTNAKLYGQLVQTYMTDFDADEYASTRLSGLSQVIAAAVGGTAIPVGVTAAPSASAAPQSLDDLLQASLALAVAKQAKPAAKAPAKAKAAKKAS